jgi:acetoacetate decarboxylase
MIKAYKRLRQQQKANHGKPWENARFIMADLPLRFEEATKILPMGMRLTEKPMATLFIVNYTQINFSVPYHEAALLIHVQTPIGLGVHCSWMIVDDDTALIYGRELLGYPKKMGVFTFDENQEKIQASISRRGKKVLCMEGKREKVQQPPPPVLDIKTFNVGGLGQGHFFNPIWLFRPKEVVHESYESEVTVTISDSEFDPIARLIAGDPVQGRIAVSDIVGLKYMLPVGIAGPFWLSHVFMFRFR